MQEIWSTLSKYENLFDYWDHELIVRQEFRNNLVANKTVKIDQEKQVDFLYRSLYLCNKKEEFFTLITPNLNQVPALNWLKQADIKLIIRFLKWLPSYIGYQKPAIEQLQFLVHIYKSEYNQYYIPIIQLLNSSQCQFIINRTANKELRNILKAQQVNLEKKEQELLYGFDATKNLLPYPTIHGDKINLILDTVNFSHQNYTTFYTNSGEEEHFTNLIQTAQSLFEIGLVEDSLYMLIAIYKHYQQEHRLVDKVQDEKIVKSLNKLVRRVLPIYALLYEPQAFNFALQIYNHYFARLTPDIASLTYLKLYDNLTLIPRDFTSILLELHQHITKIRQMRPDEIPLLLDYELNEGLSKERLSEILYLTETKLVSLPHEAFITLEFVRVLNKNNFAKALDKDRWAESYLALFKWLPSALFINQTIYEDLITNTSFHIREQLEKTIKLISYYQAHSVWLDLTEKPDLFKLKNEDLRRIILTGKFMGVL